MTLNDLSKKSTEETLPWIEKYRPQTLDEVISHNNIIETLNRFIEKKTLPHLLFYGPPGSGKTSVIMAAARALYGDKMPIMILEINASEERGIEVVRNRISQFVTAKNVFSENDEATFKLVILDEADAMTADAQAILRRVIEKFTKNARFCLICNYIKKINIALQSRCTCLRFAPLKTNYIKQKIKTIAQIENKQVTEDGYDTIIKRSNGDMRVVLNIFQSAGMAYKLINEKAVNNCLSYPTKEDVKFIVNTLVKEDFKTNYDTIEKLKTENGYALADMITEIHTALLNHAMGNETIIETPIVPEQVFEIAKHLSDVEFNLATCTNESLQLASIIGIVKLVTNKPVIKKKTIVSKPILKTIKAK
jgi:replication factor C subunit 3/5